MWFALAIVCTLSSVFGYAVLGSLPDPIDAFAEAFAAGAILTMLVMVFLVEAVQRAGRAVGIWTILGYALATLAATVPREGPSEVLLAGASACWPSACMTLRSCISTCPPAHQRRRHLGAGTDVMAATARRRRAWASRRTP
jgi:hypothetical protein